MKDDQKREFLKEVEGAAVLPQTPAEWRGMKYRKKPIVIDAVQWTGTNADEVLGFTLGRASVRDESFQRDRPRVLIIETLEGDMRAEPLDWIICGVKGEFYPCKPDIFAATYEPVEEGRDDA